jgi:Ca-activated chloride channel homolog
MKALAAALTLVFAADILAQAPAPPAKPPRKAEEKKEIDRVRKLSRRERNARMQKLDGRFHEFVADVEPIILGAELDMFLSFETDAQRDAFVEDFWNRRDIYAGTASSQFKQTYYARLEVAKEQFKRVTSDRAKMFLIQGPPADVVRADCGRLLQPIEIWKYPQIAGVGSDVRLLFFRGRGSGDFRLWNPTGGAMALAELAAEDPTAVTSADSSPGRRPGERSQSPYAYINRIQLECKDGDEIMRAITSMVQARVDLSKLFDPPQLKAEDEQVLFRSVVLPNPNAPKLNAEFSVRYPTKDGSRTDVQMMLLVPRAEVTPAAVGEAEVYTVDVVGEVLRDGKLFEKYRYRFDFPGDFKGDKLPIVVDRLLRPADYLSRIKVLDANTGAEAVIESNLSVPEIFIPEPLEPVTGTPVKVASAEPPALANKSVSDLKQELDVHETRLRIIPPVEEIVAGVQTIETIVTGSAIKGVEFWLDGRKIAVRRAPPFALDLDFGIVPQTRRIRAVALDAKGEPLTGDDIVVNTGTDPFRLRITSPRVAPKLSGLVRVEMDLHVPDDEELGALELYWNETRLATLYDEPYVQTVEIPETAGVGFLRAVASLKDRTLPPIEDVVMINTPAYMEELNVHLVELPTTVEINGKPANHLTEKSFKVTDEGKPVKLAKFEYVKNLPLSLGLAMDTSGSMRPRMEEAQKTGAQFFEQVMRRGDKAFLVAFDTDPQLVQKWSTRIADMHAGLAKLRPEEATALYDAVVYSLYNFQGIRGQKALIVISDGKDTASKFTFEQTLEYARRSGVPIYTIGIGIRGNEVDVRYKLATLSKETGGTVFYIEAARDLQRVYDDIQEELRSQYILGFYPAADVKSGGKWRELNVQVTEGKARTIRGYFP